MFKTPHHQLAKAVASEKAAKKVADEPGWGQLWALGAVKGPGGTILPFMRKYSVDRVLGVVPVIRNC